MEIMDIPIRNIFMFQKWSNVTIDRDLSELQIFKKYYNSCVNKNEILHSMTNSFDERAPKSRSAANLLRNTGNKCFKQLEYKRALDLYNNSISRAPIDSAEFGLALANRSAVLYDLKKYKESLKDIALVLRSEYPKKLLYKIFLRQSKCYVELGLIPEATDALQRTKEYFELEKKGIGTVMIAMMEDSMKSVNDELTAKKETVFSTTQEEINNVLPTPVLRDGENPKYLNASNAIHFKVSEAMDRSVVATSDIKKGDILFIEDPYAYCAHNCYNRCSFCFEKSMNCIPCPTCTTFYCSNICQTTAWDVSHKWECFNERRQILTDFRQKLCVSILIQASREGFKTQVADSSVYGDKSNNYPFMNQLLGHKSNVPNFSLNYCVKSAVWMVTYLKGFTDYFDWLYALPNRPEGSKEDMYNIVGGYLVKYMLQIDCNVNEIQESFIEFQKDASAFVSTIDIGLGIYLSTALINHSCIPNAVQCFQNKQKVVRALVDIKQGTEIKISYVGGYDMETAERQLRLKKRYMFKCLCLKCTNKNFENTNSPFKCPRCRGKAYARDKLTSAKCAQCDLTFLTRFTKQVQDRVTELLLIFQISPDPTEKKKLFGILKRIFHRDNIVFVAYYGSCLKHFKNSGEISKCFQAIQTIIQITENIYGNSSMDFVTSIAEYTNLLVNFRNILKAQNSKLYQKIANAAKEYLKKCIECLPYYISPNQVNDFAENFNNLMISGEIRSFHEDDDSDDDEHHDSDFEELLHNFVLLHPSNYQ